MSDLNEINKAIKAHSVWKVRLKDAVDTGSSEFTPARVRDSHICDFGKWLATLPPAEKAMIDFQQIDSLHEKFHAEAANVLQLAIGGQREKAHLALTDIQSDFVYTSARLINSLADWKRKIA